MAKKEFARTQLALFSFRSPCFFLLQICFALSSLVVIMVGMLGTSKGLASANLMCSFMNMFTTLLLCQVICFHSLLCTLRTILPCSCLCGCFVVISGDLETTRSTSTRCETRACKSRTFLENTLSLEASNH